MYILYDLSHLVSYRYIRPLKLLQYILINEELNMTMSRIQCESISSPNMMFAANAPTRANVADVAAAITLCNTYMYLLLISVL